MSYADDHASAYADVAESGAVATFIETTPGENDPLTVTGSEPTVSEIEGVAIEVQGSESELSFDAGELVEGQRVVLLWVPKTYGALPSPGNKIVWSATQFTVAERWPLRPDGVAIMARVLVVR